MSQGSVAEFKSNWNRPEAEYCHFTRGEPENQIQFAFRQNWLEFAKIMEPLKPWAGKRSLEVGAGRGTMSMYFADAGFDCTLVDTSPRALECARHNFESHGLPVWCEHGDAMGLPYNDESFDVVHSYGLMEHFDQQSLGKAINEQIRVLKSGGLWIAYVVPGEPNACDWRWKLMSDILGGNTATKSTVFRNQISYLHYMRELPDCGLRGVEATGVYKFPIISPSPDFPFTLNAPEIELEIVASMHRMNMWRCQCDAGQAFIVWGWKQ